MNSDVFKNISYGVYVVSALDGERPTGCIANSLMQITSDPAIIAVSMNHDNFTNRCIKNMNQFGVSILTQGGDPAVIGTFGFASGKEINKFDQFPYEIKKEVPILKECNSILVCDVIGVAETETHTVFLGKVAEGDLKNNEPVMTYAYYHTVIKGKSPKNAPTYIKEESEITKKKVYTCAICGYEYDGEVPFEELPDDYICPVCKHPASDFEPIGFDS